jgi:hypothetical protein
MLRLPDGETISYRFVQDEGESARPTALQILRDLADGRIEDAALLSNAPRRRYETLRDYEQSVGPQEFKRVYGQYFFPENRVVAEIALGPRRAVIWDLGEAGHHLAAQYFVEVEGRFLVDDVPSKERAALQKVVQDYRRQNEKRATSPARKD